MGTDMHHSPELAKEVKSKSGTDSQPRSVQTQMVDRSVQRWANIVGSLFSVASFTCQLALSVLTVFFISIVAQNGETGMTLILVGMGATLCLGMLLLEYTHARALAGYRDAREKNARYIRAIASGVLAVILFMIHPLMALAIPVSAGLGALAQFIISRRVSSEPLWDFLPEEAISILSGRDRVGMTMASTHPKDSALMGPVSHAGTALSVVLSTASASYLIATDVMTMAAVAPLMLGSLWATQSIVDYTQERFARRDVKIQPTTTVELSDPTMDQGDIIGLSVKNLNVRNQNGDVLLSNIQLNVPPGQVLGIIGESGAGKTLLLQSIADPFSLSDMDVSGRSIQGGTDLWMRKAADQSIPVVLVPEAPLLLPASGAENLTCFHNDDLLARGKWLLEQLVYAVDVVDQICAAPNAQNLPTMHRNALSMARAFLLSPQVLLFDRPETGLPDKQIAALIHRIKQETRMGHSCILATDNRALLETCDKLAVMHNGNIIDFGPTQEVNERMEAGWARFVGIRQLETEETLIHWIRSHFARDGDEENRRKVAAVATDMLAFSCQTADGRNPGNVSFIFKHFKGYCVLRMQDEDPPVGTSTFKKALSEAESNKPDHQLPLLTALVRASLEIECGSQMEDRMLTAHVETYDPRDDQPTSEISHAVKTY